MHIHILGICGTFMGGLAVLAQQAGHTVTGCDANVYPPMSTQLTAQGIRLIEGFDPDQINLKADLYVIGNVIARGNLLIEEILNRGLPYTSGPAWIGQHILSNKWVLAVAGTHGKTTTSAMLAWILQDAGYAPGFLIGGVPLNFGVSARLAEKPDRASDFFVIEADEYDTAFFDKRSKFVHYRPRTAILNNLEYDHADIFADLGAIETQFHHLVRTIPGQGRLIVNARDAALKRVLARGCWSECSWFGGSKDEAGWTQKPVDALDFEVLLDAQKMDTVRWNLQGEHNRLNALAAIAAAHHVGINPAQAIDALSRFINVKRRMEIRGSVRHITVYDDFAHHPTAIAATLEGLRKTVGAQRILAVLEPRSNTMKLGTLKEALAASLESADLIFAYQHNSEPTRGQTSKQNSQQKNERNSGQEVKQNPQPNSRSAGGWDLSAALAALGARAQTFSELPSLISAITKAAQPHDHILVMSNGSFGNVHQKILEELAR